jgi:hypothetical protein
MKRLILTTSGSGEGCLKFSGLADMVIPFELALIGGPPPSDAVLAELLSGSSKRRSTPLPRWADVVGRREREKIASKGLGLLDFCAMRDGGAMGRSAAECAIDAGLAPELLPRTPGCIEAQAGPGECGHRRQGIARDCHNRTRLSDGCRRRSPSPTRIWRSQPSPGGPIEHRHRSPGSICWRKI